MTLNNSAIRRGNSSLLNVEKRAHERSLSRVSISNAKIQVKAANTKPALSQAFSPNSTSSKLFAHNNTFNKALLEKPNLLGGADIPMFKTT
jgi:hypothetical protein